MFEKRVVVDCRGHLLGRLASVVAKELLAGQRVICVRTEEINVSGSLYRNKLKYAEFKNKKSNTKPWRSSQIHYRSPSKMLWRCIRGMLPHKTARGAAALRHLKVFEGVPPPFDKIRRQIVPAALRVTRLKPGRRFCSLGRLAKEFGWSYGDVVSKLEEKRKVKSLAYFRRQKAAAGLRAQAIKAASSKTAALNKELHTMGF
jgi:large subunit ribosomal protein L13Ae